MSDVSREEFRDLVRQVRTLQRTVGEQQNQIAKLRHRTRVDAESGTDPDDDAYVPRSSVELCVLDVLKDFGAEKDEVSIEAIKTEARKCGKLKSEAKIVVENWFEEGYLAGNPEEAVRVVEWPPEEVPAEEAD